MMKLTQCRIDQLTEQAKTVMPPMVAEYASKMRVEYGRIAIRHQRTRWGSCSTKGNLNFNCLLMLTPDYVQKYVVVHELAHRKKMNHSSDFWMIVESVIPDYKKAKRWLRENGVELIQRMDM